MNYTLIRTDVLERHFRDRPEVLQFIEENRIVESWTDGSDHDMRVIPGDRRDLMALPAQSIDGRIDEPWFIDLRLDAEDYGAIYVGKTMFHHMASLVGYCEVEELRRTLRELEKLDVEYLRVRKLLSRISIVRDDMGDNDVQPSSGTPAEGGRRAKAGTLGEDRQTPSSAA
jgi:hypothetical protein